MNRPQAKLKNRNLEAVVSALNNLQMEIKGITDTQTRNEIREIMNISKALQMLREKWISGDSGFGSNFDFDD
jgi:hypothetical protein